MKVIGEIPGDPTCEECRMEAVMNCTPFSV
jgi:hypothetical protein